MTYRVTFTRRAQADLHGLFDYLADRFSIANAQRMWNRSRRPV